MRRTGIAIQVNLRQVDILDITDYSVRSGTATASSSLAVGLSTTSEIVSIEAGRHYRDDQLVVHLGVNRRPKDDIGLRRDSRRDNLSRLLHLRHRHVIATGYVKENTPGSINANLDQRRLDRLLGSFLGSVITRCPPDAHQC